MYTGGWEWGCDRKTIFFEFIKNSRFLKHEYTTFKMKRRWVDEYPKVIFLKPSGHKEKKYINIKRLPNVRN